MTTTQPVTTSQPAAAAATPRTAPTRTISVAGTPFAYRELGPRTGVPLVFLHHFSAVLDDWDPQVIDGIAAKRHVIAFDNRGIAASRGTVPHTIDEMAADAVAFIRALGYEQVDLLGFSLGGGVAQVITLEHPELVRRVILGRQGTQVVGVHVGYVDTDLTAALDAEKIEPAAVAASALDAVEAGEPEAVVDEVSRHVKAGLSDDHRLLYTQLELEFAALLASTSDLAAAAAGSRSQED